MAHTFTYLKYHVVFSTASRRALIGDEIANELYAYMGGIVRELKGTADMINGTPDHVHLLVGLPAELSIARAVQTIKANSSRWLHQSDMQGDFAWQVGYGAFTVSASGVDSVRKYIENQAAHHRKLSFQEELLALLKKHKIDYDPRFVFD